MEIEHEWTTKDGVKVYNSNGYDVVMYCDYFDEISYLETKLDEANKKLDKIRETVLF